MTRKTLVWLGSVGCLVLAPGFGCGDDDQGTSGQDGGNPGVDAGSDRPDSGPLPVIPDPDYEIPGTLYYVDANNGSDSNPGTSAEPWQTLPYALSQVVGGDGILLRDGDYGDLVFGAEEAAPIPEVFSDWVTVRPDEGHAPVLGRVELGIFNRNGYLLPFSEVGNSDLRLRLDGLTIRNQMEINGSRYVDVRNCAIHTEAELNELTASGSCLAVNNGQHVQLRNNDISHCGVGVALMTTDLVMVGNDIHHTSHDGMKLYGGYNWIVEGNAFHDIDDGLDDDDPDPEERNNHADGIHMHTVIHQGGYDNPRWPGGGGNIVIRGNLFFHIECMAVMINQNDWDGTWGDFVFENNVFGPSNGRLFIQGSSFTSFVFRHNTVLYAPHDVWTSMFGRVMEVDLTDPASAYYHVQVWGNPEGHEYYNNILCSASGSLAQDLGVVTHNLFIGPDDLDSLPYEAIPGNIQDFIDGGGVLGLPVTGGAAHNAGTTDHVTPAADIYATPRDSQPDIGAVELP